MSTTATPANPERSQASQAVVALVFLIGFIALPKAGAVAVMGPGAVSILWLPALLWGLAAGLPLALTAATARFTLALPAATPRAIALASYGLALAARLAVALIVVRAFLDPTGTALPGRVAGTVAAALPGLGFLALYVAAVVAGILVLPYVMASGDALASGPAAGAKGAGQASLRPFTELPTTRLILATVIPLSRFARAIALRGLAALALVLTATVAWLFFGLAGLRAVFAPGASAAAPTLAGRLRGTADRFRAAMHGAPLGSFGSFGSSRRDAIAVWRAPLSLTRVEGQITRQKTWKLRSGATSDLVELNELAYAVLIAYDTALAAKGGVPAPSKNDDDDDEKRPRMMVMGAKSRRPRYTGYEIAIARAWTTPTYHGLVVRISPPPAAEDAANLPAGKVVPIIDAHSSWVKDQLTKSLNLADPRIGTDPHREGQLGLFISLTREGAAEEAEASADEAGDAVVNAVRRGLREMGESPDLFKPTSGPDRGYDTLSYRFTTTHWTQTEAAGSIAARERYLAVWLVLRNAIRFIGGFPEQSIALWHDDETREFVVTIEVPPPPFPGDASGDKSTSLPAFIAEHAAAMVAEPRCYCAGLDPKGAPVWVDFRLAPHVLVVGGTGSGKTASGVISPVLQLASIQAPEEFGVWLLDSRKRELRAQLGGLPHVEQMVIATDGQIVLDTVAAYVGLMRERQEQLNGRAWTRASGLPWYLLVIEEWQVMKASIEATDRDAMKQIEAAMNELAAIGRSVGCHVLLASQKGTTDVLPSAITINLPTKVMGFSRQADYQAILGAQVSLPQEHPGRLALGRGDEPVIIQGLYATEHEAEKIVRELAARWPKPVREAREPAASSAASQPEPATAPGRSEFADGTWFGPREAARHAGATPIADDRDSIVPRDPTEEEVSTLNALTATRLIYRHQAKFDTWQPISQSLLHDLIAGRPGRSGSVQGHKVTKALQELTRLEVLVPRAGSARGDRQLNQLGWPVAYRRITGETDDEEAG